MLLLRHRKRLVLQAKLARLRQIAMLFPADSPSRQHIEAMQVEVERRLRATTS